MPGPVSDSYDPEFSTSSNASEIHDGIAEVRDKITKIIGKDNLIYILDLVRDKNNNEICCYLAERELRIIRFCLNRVLEEI